MPNSNKLSDNATLSKKKDLNTGDSHWKQLDAKGKWQYIKDYYLLKIVVAVLFICFLGYVGFVTLGPKDESELYCMVLNDTLDQTKSQKLLDDFSQKIGISGPRHIYTFDDTYSLDRNDPDYTTQQKISTYAFGEKLDLIIADEDTIKYIAENGYLIDLTQILPSDLYSTVTDELVFAKRDKDETECAYAVSLENSSLYQDMSSNYIYKNGKKMAIGIVGKTQKRDNAIQLIRYLLTNKI